MGSRRRIGGWLLALMLTAGCGPTGYIIEPGDLDGGTVELRSELVSESLRQPTEAQRQSKVVIAAHGFTASTYEMSALADHLRLRGFLVSNVLLGGHGQSIEAFAASTWPDWGAPIKAEYDRLRALGFTDISCVTASTGGTLTLDLIASQQLTPAPQRLVFVGPLLHFRDWRTGFVDLLTWLGVRNSPNDLEQNAVGNWYRNRPVGQIKSLVELTDRLKGHLDTGISLPAPTRTLIIQSDEDPTVDPSSATAIQAGLRGEVQLQRLPSRLHVPIWPLHTHRDWNDTEVAQQRQLLGDIERFLSE